MTKYYVGMDVHQASIVNAVTNAAGKVVMESIIETKAQTVRDFIKGLRGEVHVTFEEGTQAAWLYDLIRPLVTEVVVCNPRHNKLLEVGNKADRLDARKLAQLLRAGMREERSTTVRVEHEHSRRWSALMSAWWLTRPG
jgi:hypothetical protein